MSTETAKEDGPDTPTPDAEEDETPDLAADEKATLPDDLADVAADVEAETGASSDDSDDVDLQETDDADGSDDSADAPDALGGDSAAGGPTWGDQYVSVLSVVLAAIVEEHGDDDATADQAEIAHLATQHPINLNESADRVFAEMAGTSEMDPKQALVVSTGILAATVLLKETDVAADALGELGGLGGMTPTVEADADAEGGEAA